MKTVLIAILTLTDTFLTAQNTVTWVGGTPGKETKWNEARNWSNHRVPDEFSDVVIPDVSTTSFSLPVIESGSTEVNSIALSPFASLTIEKEAQLIIHENALGILEQNFALLGSLILIKENGDENNVAAHLQLKN